MWGWPAWWGNVGCWRWGPQNRTSPAPWCWWHWLHWLGIYSCHLSPPGRKKILDWTLKKKTQLVAPERCLVVLFLPVWWQWSHRRFQSPEDSGFCWNYQKWWTLWPWWCPPVHFYTPDPEGWRLAPSAGNHRNYLTCLSAQKREIKRVNCLKQTCE